jgi:hypothetical protein
VKTVSANLGVARSNVIDRHDGKRPQRGPQARAGDDELAGAIAFRAAVRPPASTTDAPSHTRRAPTGEAERFIQTSLRA